MVSKGGVSSFWNLVTCQCPPGFSNLLSVSLVKWQLRKAGTLGSSRFCVFCRSKFIPAFSRNLSLGRVWGVHPLGTAGTPHSSRDRGWNLPGVWGPELISICISIVLWRHWNTCLGLCCPPQRNRGWELLDLSRAGNGSGQPGSQLRRGGFALHSSFLRGLLQNMLGCLTEIRPEPLAEVCGGREQISEGLVWKKGRDFHQGSREGFWSWKC